VIAIFSTYRMELYVICVGKAFDYVVLTARENYRAFFLQFARDAIKLSLVVQQRSQTVLFDAQTEIVVIKVFYLPTDVKRIALKKNIKIYIKTAPTCFGAIIIIRERIV